MEYAADKFYALLKWLDPDDQRAAEKYESIRRRLVQFFALRQCVAPEELTDETISRVAGHVAEVATSYHGEPSKYFYAVARKVLIDNSGKPPAHQLSEAGLLASSVEADDQLYECFHKCMLTFTADNRELLLAYYDGSGRSRAEIRRRLATQLGVTVNALRIRAVRTTVILRECVENCMKSHQRQEKD